MFFLAQLPFPEIDPVALRLGPIAVRWYGIAYLLGFLAGYLGLRTLARRRALQVEEDRLGDLITWLVVGVMIGGRAGWWLFYRVPTGEPEPWYEPLAMWHGGMSFHGGLVGVAVALYGWSKLRQVNFWNLADGAALVAPLGLFFGRIANFVNAELVGRATSRPWGVVFPGEKFARHPSQLYEAVLEGPVLMLLLLCAPRLLRLRDGQVAALFAVGYGIIRFGIEFTREPDGQLGFIAFGWLTMGQFLSGVVVVIGLGVWWRSSRSVHMAAIPTCSGHDCGRG